MFCTKTNLEIAQETFYFNEIIATCGTGSRNFRAIAKSKFGTLPSDVNICKMTNNEWMIQDATYKTNLANCHLTLTFVKYNIPANINTLVFGQWIIVPKAQNNTHNSQNKGI